MTEKVKWGVIGAGGIARRRTIKETMMYAQMAEIKALMDIDEKVVKEVGREWGIDRWFTDVEKLLQEDIEAVYIASPNYVHYQQAKASLEAGKHVLCEKPLSLTLEEGKELALIAEEKGLKLGVAFMMRFNVYHKEIKRLIEEGALGQLVAGRAQLTCWYPPLPSAWRQDKEKGGGGALIDMGCHCIDLLEWFFGETIEVAAFLDTITHSYLVEDTSTAILKFRNGAQGIVDNYFNVPDKAAKNILEVYGTKGAVIAHQTIGQDPGGKMWLYQEKGEKSYNAEQEREENAYKEIKLEPLSLYAQEIDAFSQWIRGGEKPVISYEVGLRNSKVIEAIYRAQEEKRVITV